MDFFAFPIKKKARKSMCRIMEDGILSGTSRQPREDAKPIRPPRGSPGTRGGVFADGDSHTDFQGTQT